MAIARDWADTTQASLTSREQAFLDASIAAEAGERTAAQRRTRRLRQLVALLAALLLLAAVTTVYAVHTQDAIAERRNAIAQQRNSAIAQNVAAQAAELYRTNQDLATQLALTAHRLAPTTHTRNSLIATLATTLINQPHETMSVDFSPDGHILATEIGDGTVRLWDIANPRNPTEQTTLTGHTSRVWSVAFSPDGQTLATGGSGDRDRTARITPTNTDQFITHACDHIRTQSPPPNGTTTCPTSPTTRPARPDSHQDHRLSLRREPPLI